MRQKRHARQTESASQRNRCYAPHGLCQQPMRHHRNTSRIKARTTRFLLQQGCRTSTCETHISTRMGAEITNKTCQRNGFKVPVRNPCDTTETPAGSRPGQRDFCRSRGVELAPAKRIWTQGWAWKSHIKPAREMAAKVPVSNPCETTETPAGSRPGQRDFCRSRGVEL